MTNTSSSTHRAALVFGGSRGIGAAVVKELAAQGIAVALTYAKSPDQAVEVAHAAERCGVPAFALKADSTDADAIKAAVVQTAECFGRLDIAVINAGVLVPGIIDAYGLDDLDRMIAINIRGVFVAIQAAAARMNDGGRIITIGSNIAARTSFPGSSVYAMTKGAVASLVRGAALDLAPRRITVNNVQPGPTLTDMTSAYADRLRDMVPLKRIADPAEIASFVAYLASDKAGYITGASLTIDGGLAT